MPNDRHPLARRYHALLRAYPRSYRRERGAEIVTTLLDAAPAERTRPTVAEAFDLIRGGVAYRFRVRGTGAVFATVCTAVIAGVAAGALGGFVGWQSAPPLPGPAEAARLVQPALPAGASVHTSRWDFLFADSPKYTDPDWVYLLGGTDEYEAGRVHVAATYPSADNTATVDAARTRLAAQGWSLGPAPRGTYPETVAYRDGLRIKLFTMSATGDELILVLTRTAPSGVLPLTTLGLLAGALGGWLLAAWAFRRAAGASPTRRAGGGLLVIGGVIALFPATAYSLVAIVAGYVTAPEPVPVWIGYVFMLARPLAALGGAALLAALLTASTGRRLDPTWGAIA